MSVLDRSVAPVVAWRRTATRMAGGRAAATRRCAMVRRERWSMAPAQGSSGARHLRQTTCSPRSAPPVLLLDPLEVALIGQVDQLAAHRDHDPALDQITQRLDLSPVVAEMGRLRRLSPYAVGRRVERCARPWP